MKMARRVPVEIAKNRPFQEDYESTVAALLSSSVLMRTVSRQSAVVSRQSAVVSR